MAAHNFQVIRSRSSFTFETRKTKIKMMVNFLQSKNSFFGLACYDLQQMMVRYPHVVMLTGMIESGAVLRVMESDTPHSGSKCVMSAHYVANWRIASIFYHLLIT